ncbi:hypothetical protein [Corynebacterium sp. MSK044]|uniref:hypothetical protein n=1 Tax=Corynebacterium sp. MSK044 TaxID=3050195 RepID=UPI00254E507F|nr:hypothetical protein [Corynebacterium sp. MSK044]
MSLQNASVPPPSQSPTPTSTPKAPSWSSSPIHGPNNPGASFIGKLPTPLFGARTERL